MSSTGRVPVNDSFDNIIKVNPDGTLTRDAERLTITPAASDPNLPIPVLSKDLPVNDSNRTWFRIFLPRDKLVSSRGEKLPLIVYFHGGGFILMSAASSVFHRFYHDLALRLPAVIVSVEYRLAPEHRLPAAYEDSVEALRCIGRAEDEWLTEHADFSKCYLMGTSAGGNIAYNTGLRVASMAVDELGPLRIQGLILHHAYFGGTERTESELRLVNDRVLPLAGCDRMWQLALPIGADRDHEYCNPTVESNPGLMVLDKVKSLGWRVLVTGCDGDPTIDRQVALAKRLKEKGVLVTSHFIEGQYHGYELMEAEKSGPLIGNIKNFISVV